MTRYEELESKADACIGAATRCYLENQGMAKMWFKHAIELDKMAKALGVPDAEAVC
jgi:hypothetical protein